jgi:hypothetical protein
MEGPIAKRIGRELKGIAPTGTSVVASGKRALSGTQPPSVQVTSKLCPWRWIG